MATLEKNARSSEAPDRKAGWWHPPHSRHPSTEWAHPAGGVLGCHSLVIPNQGKRGQPNAGDTQEEVEEASETSSRFTSSPGFIVSLGPEERSSHKMSADCPQFTAPAG